MENIALYKQRFFEVLILKLICGIGTLRSVVALIMDGQSQSGYIDLWVDVGFLIAFVIPLILMIFPFAYERVAIIFFSILSLLLALNWINKGGLEGTAEYNFIAGIVMFSIILRGKWLITLVALLIALEIALIYAWDNYSSSLKFLLDDYQPEVFNYLFVSIAIVVITYYSKAIFDRRRLQLIENRKSLRLTMKQIKDGNRSLMIRKKELVEANRLLEQRVEQRTRELETQKESIAKYLQLSLEEINQPLQKTIVAINNLQRYATDEIIDMLISEGEDLKVEIDNLKSHLQSQKNV